MVQPVVTRKNLKQIRGEYKAERSKNNKRSTKEVNIRNNEQGKVIMKGNRSIDL